MSLLVEHARSTELYRALCGVMHSADGNLLECTDVTVAEAQTEFLRWALHLASPQVILETGTNKGLFGYLVSLLGRGVTIHTFDIDPNARQAVDLLNRAQENVVCVFHEGDSRDTLRQFSGAAQFAWIDGGHDPEVALSDLLHCYRLRVPYVAVDDTAYPSVHDAVRYLLQHAPYRAVGNPFLQHDRRKALLLALGDGPEEPPGAGTKPANTVMPTSS